MNYRYYQKEQVDFAPILQNCQIIEAEWRMHASVK